MKHERTSSRVARLAAIAMVRPDLLTPKELKSIAGSALTQAPGGAANKRRKRRKKRVAKKVAVKKRAKKKAVKKSRPLVS